jgi:hypothetical protein
MDLADADAFADWLMPLRQCEWVVYAKRPFEGPEQVLAYTVPLHPSGGNLQLTAHRLGRGIRTRVTALRGTRFIPGLSTAILYFSIFIGLLSIAVHPVPA